MNTPPHFLYFEDDEEQARWVEENLEWRWPGSLLTRFSVEKELEDFLQTGDLSVFDAAILDILVPFNRMGATQGIPGAESLARDSWESGKRIAERLRSARPGLPIIIYSQIKKDKISSWPASLQLHYVSKDPIDGGVEKLLDAVESKLK